MFELADRLLALGERGRPIAVATAVSIDGSAPRTIGTSMAFDGAEVIGSIAGGCVEGAVVGVCEEVLGDGLPRTVEYGVSDETAFSVGLTCGGQIRVHVRLLTDDVADQLRVVTAGGAAGTASVLSLVRSEHRARLDAELAARIAIGETGLGVIDCDGELIETFFEVSTPAPHLIVFGAMEFSAALAQAARMLGYRITVCDPRPLFATPTRFPGAEVVVSWPTTWLAAQQVDERTMICVLSHDARFDAELIAAALDTPAAFVGAMGSRTTHDRRVASLRERGVSEESISRLRSPIGLDIGASTVEETAVAILAEIIAVRTRASTLPLVATAGPIHRRATAELPLVE
ncbi:XdhC family protein [Lacisediminihabitans changchengi]|uniref:XdhC family protein n=1 Tax=Lacisediminihabitans changchengi TaxID=2787634 RepID=A0A934SNY2_9MICO|nr:XdhC/CoxI family protein [Lacisediminihabitans changchengi]MBK4346325.1 XdhC family protein [Lacisediminihabitans changchengi]